MPECILRRFYTLGLVLSMWSCAQIVPPSGGEKDTVPPQLLEAIPANYSTRFQTNEIWLAFDEYVQLKDINSQLLISPPLNTRPEVIVKKRGVLLRLKENLLPNTTYTFNFGDGIVDLNEGNPCPLRYVVSTGEIIDSLSVKGRIADALSGAGVEGTKVMLFPPENDSLPLTGRPLYFGRSDKSGLFSIDNVREGSYRLFALEESNNNYRFDKQDERIGFATEILYVNGVDNLYDREVLLFRQDAGAKYIRSVWTDGNGYFSMETDQQSRTSRWVVEDNQGSPMDFTMRTERPDSIRIWLDPLLSPARIILLDGDEPRDTIAVEKIELPELAQISAPLPSFRSEDGIAIETDPRASIVDTALIRLKRDSTLLSLSVEPGALPGEWLLRSDFRDGLKYSLEIFPGAFGWREIANDTLVTSLQCHPSELYGNLELEIKTGVYLGQLVLELLDSGGKLKQKVVLGSSELEKVRFLRMLPGKYSVKILEDRDLSGDWTSGNFLDNLQPENYFSLEEGINIRSNWDIKVSVDLNK